MWAFFGYARREAQMKRIWLVLLLVLPLAFGWPVTGFAKKGSSGHGGQGGKHELRVADDDSDHRGRGRDGHEDHDHQGRHQGEDDEQNGHHPDGESEAGRDGHRHSERGEIETQRSEGAR